MAELNLPGLFGRIPLGVGIGGRKHHLLMAVAGALPARQKRRKACVYRNLVAEFDLCHIQERCFYFFRHNLMRHYERSALGKLMRRVLQPGDFFIDVGANLGFYSLIAKGLGANAVLFEPEREHAQFLQRNQGIFDTVSDLALSDRSGTELFFIGSRKNFGASSLIRGDQPWERAGYSGQMEVRVSTLDQELHGLNLPLDRIRLIKVDVEGAEAKVVMGMRKFLREGFHPLLWCEVRGLTSDRAPNSYLEVTETLREFQLQAFVPNKDRWLPFQPGGAPPQVFDLLFARESDLSEA